MRSAQTIIEMVRRQVKARLTGKPRDTETVKRGLAGGGWKSATA